MVDHFEFCCPRCGQNVSAYEDSRGEKVACPACENEILIPPKNLPDACQESQGTYGSRIHSREAKRNISRVKLTTPEFHSLLSEQISQIVSEFGPEDISDRDIIFTKKHYFHSSLLGSVDCLGVFLVESVRGTEISAKRLIRKENVLTGTSYSKSKERHTFRHDSLDVQTLEVIILVLDRKI